MFIGRTDEIRFLEDRYAAKGGQLVVLYGRRRIGKTETLRKFCEDKEHVFYSCAEITDEQQLRMFRALVLEKGIPASRYLSAFRDWEQAFGTISEFPGSGKKLLVVDEFPYMVRSNPSIPSVLQNLWDGQLKDENAMIVLCGSAMSFLEKKVLSEKNPLYGRATGILKMLPMTFHEASMFHPKYSPTDKIATYSILGGVPHYLKQFDQDRSLRDNIIDSVLTRGSILYSEVEFLMRQELRETSVYNTIITAIATGNTKLNDIFQKTQIDRGKLTAYLRNLIELGIIRREFPVTDGTKKRGKVQRGLYQLTDHFFRFWYAFAFPYISGLEAGDAEGIYKHAIQPELDRFVSGPFEEVCRDFLRMQNRQGLLPFHFTNIGRWWHRDAEIDIVATDLSRRQILIGECRYRTTPVSLSDLNKMLAKLVPFPDLECVHRVVFSKSGFTDAAREKAAAGDIRLVGVDEIVYGRD